MTRTTSSDSSTHSRTKQAGSFQCPAHLLALHLVVLRGSDLPFAIALQPGIGPHLALLGVRMHLVFADSVLAAVNDGYIFAEEAHLGIVDGAAARRVRALFIPKLISLVVALAISARAL